jgi:hypothetical protein
MLREGKPQREIAQVFGVTEGAISKAKGELSVGVIKVAAMEHGHELVTQNIDAAQELNRINRVINDLMDEVTAKPEVLNRLTKGVMAIIEDRGTKEDRQRVREALSVILKNQDLQIKASQEIRGQLSLQWEISKGMVDVREMAAFQRVVVETIRKQRPEVARELVNALKREKALRSSVSITE